MLTTDEPELIEDDELDEKLEEELDDELDDELDGEGVDDDEVPDVVLGVDDVPGVTDDVFEEVPDVVGTGVLLLLIVEVDTGVVEGVTVGDTLEVDIAVEPPEVMTVLVPVVEKRLDAFVGQTV